MKHWMVAALCAGGMTLAATQAHAQNAGPTSQPAADLPVADLSNPDLIYDPESNTYYDPDTGDVFAAPAPIPADPSAPVPQTTQAPIPTNFGPLQTGIYAGAGMSTLDVKAYGISGIVGYDFGRYFGAEVQLGFGVADDEEIIDDVGIPVRDGTGQLLTTIPERVLSSSGFDGHIAAYGVARAPLGDKIELLARAGVHYTGLGGQIVGRASNPAFESLQGQPFLFDYDSGATGFAVGGGVQYNFGDFDLQAIRIDVTYLDFGDLDSADVNNVGNDLPLDGNVLGGGLRFIDDGLFLSASLMQRF